MMEERYINNLGLKHQIIRFIWCLVWTLTCKWLPRSLGDGWKRFILRLFGAKISDTARVYSTVKIYYPANLIMEDYACLASDVDCYNVAMIRIGRYAAVSQGAFLCTASHDITSPTHDLITAPIVIEDRAWVGADAFVGMGVTVSKGSVVGARAALFKSTNQWEVVGGNPAKFIKKRVIMDT